MLIEIHVLAWTVLIRLLGFQTSPLDIWISNDNKDIIKQLKKTVDIVIVIIKYFNIYNFKKTCKI